MIIVIYHIYTILQSMCVCVCVYHNTATRFREGLNENVNFSRIGIDRTKVAYTPHTCIRYSRTT